MMKKQLPALFLFFAEFPTGVLSQEIDSNAYCTGAHPIESIPFELTEGSIAPFDSEETTLEAQFDYRESAPNCTDLSAFASNTHGAWYEFVGNGSCVAATSPLQNVTVLTGDDCGYLECPHTGSTEFTPEDGVRYRVLVVGDGDYSSFAFKLEPCQEEEAEPLNDACTSATVVDSLPFTSSGDTSLVATTPNQTDFSTGLPCIFIEPDIPVVWYEVRGDGTCFTAHTRGSSYDTILAVYSTKEDSSCSDMMCVIEGDQIAPDTPEGMPDDMSEVFWQTEKGLTYKIAVGGYQAAGAYELSITQSEACPEAEFCTMCADGSRPDPDLVFDRDHNCAIIDKSIHAMHPLAPPCIFWRQVGIVYCGCSVTTQETCNICGEENHVITNPDVVLPREGNLPVCSDFEHVPAISGEATCAHMLTYGDRCGCQEEVPEFGVPPPTREPVVESAETALPTRYPTLNPAAAASSDAGRDGFLYHTLACCCAVAFASLGI